MAYQTIQCGPYKRSRWIPDNGMKLTQKDGLGVVYVYETAGALYAVGYTVKAARASFHHRYKNRAAIASQVVSFFAGLSEHSKRVQQYRADSYKPHTFKAGDIVTNSWGYDQTNVDWYRVARISKHYVWLKPICGHVEEQTQAMAGMVMPAINTESDDASTWGFSDKTEPEIKRRASENHVCMEFGSGSKWNGKPLYCSWYA